MAEDAPLVDVDPGETSDISEPAPSGGDAPESGAWPADVQAAYTKKTQALADERKTWESQRSEQTQQLQQYAQQLQQQQYARQAAQQQAQTQQQGQQSQNTMLDQLRQMPYLDGATAAQLMERMVGEGITPLQQAIQQRDQVIAQMRKDYTSLRDTVGQGRTKQAEADLEQRFIQLRDETGLPDEEVINDFLRDVYYSFEGGDWDRKFPETARSRIEGLRKVFRSMDRATAKQAKTSPFPSKGGESSLTSGKTGGYKTPEERTNELWPMLNPGQTE
jgi:multidrug efflux pump subunit AcrA (membrane-fusion protein)